MPQTLDNGIVVPVNADAWNLTPDLATLGNKANVITVVLSLSQRNALATWVGRTIRRMDIGGSLDYWDGTQWISSLISTIWTNTSNAVTTAGGGPGILTLDTANSQNPSFITTPGAGQLQVALAGVYSFTWHAASLNNTSGYMSIKNQAGTGTYVLANYPASGEQSVSIPNLYLAANAIVSFVMGPSANVTIGSTIRASKIG